MKHRTKKILSYILAFAIVIAAGLWVASRFLHLGDVEFTDNARICQQIVPVNCRVRGYIKEIRFDEFSHVSKGDTLVIIDDTDLRLDVTRAEAAYRNALAGRRVTDLSVGVASANAAVTDAAIAEARVVMDQALTDYNRYAALLEREAVTRREFEAVKTDYEAKKARYETLARQRSASSSVVNETRRRADQNDADIDLAAALLEMARLNLSYTVITAPCDGYAARKEIQVGQLIEPGRTLLEIVDKADIWVTANYKETQLSHISPGQEAIVTVDAIPGVTFNARVSAISHASGAALSVMPQDNSAGNFVKVRQRIPVRLDFTADNDSAAMSRLRAGMNVECKIKY